MESIKNLLEFRNKAKKRKPAFVIKESKFSARVESKWRYPRGKHSAVRQQHRGRSPLPTPGYGSPRAVRGLHSSGLEPVVVHTVEELKLLNPKNQGGIIGSTVGRKKRIQLLTLAKEKSITLLNCKNVSQELEMLQKDFEQKKKEKQEKRKEKLKKEEAKAKKTEEKKKSKAKEQTEAKETVEEKLAEEEQKQRESAEKTIIKRQ